MSEKPTAFVVDCESGETRTEPLVGAELKDYRERENVEQPEPPPTLAEQIAALADELAPEATAADALKALAERLK